jgi:hypothetical protein
VPPDSPGIKKFVQKIRLLASTQAPHNAQRRGNGYVQE